MKPQTKHKIEKNAPLIFSCISIVGIFGTAVLSVRAGMEAEKILSEMEERPTNVKPWIEATWKCYIWTVMAVLGTSAAVIASHRLSSKQIAALSSVAAAGATTFNEYRNKVREAIGDKAERDLYEEVRAKSDLQMYPVTPSNNTETNDLFWDAYSERYFRSNHEIVQQAIYNLNRGFQLKGTMCVNDWYSFVGLDGVDEGDEIIWDSDYYWENGLTPWIDVYFQTDSTEDGEICHRIFFEFEPTKERSEWK